MNFSLLDRKVLKAGMSILPMWERQILIYRFWENLSIEEIARLMDMGWDDVDQSIETSFAFLRNFCLKEPTFSLSEQNKEAA